MENVKWGKYTYYKSKVGGGKMQYECIISNIVDDEEVTVQIGDIKIIVKPAEKRLHTSTMRMETASGN